MNIRNHGGADSRCDGGNEMINLLEDYISRSIPQGRDFQTHSALSRKVRKNGAFCPFYGNTVVFDLNAETKQELQMLQEELYGAAGWMFSQRLDPSTFHMTLHDLVNAPERSENLLYRMAEAERKAKSILKEWGNQPPLHMKGTWLFNMMNTSVVLGLAPADEDSRNRLAEMYTRLEDVVPLGYGLTPHITMAYFRPGTYTEYDLNCLRHVLHPVQMETYLHFENLHYQQFSDMNHYESK